MKFIFALALIIACASAIHVCFPEEYHTDVVTFEPANQDIFAGRVWFSFSRQRLRHDADVVIYNDNRTHNRYSFLFDWTHQVAYIISYVGNTANCTVQSFHEPLEPPCLSKKAKHRGSVLLGGVLTADNYEFNDGKVALDILADANVNVPIRVVRRRKDGKTAIDEYWNFKEKVDSDAFVVPEVCKSENVVARDSISFADIYNDYTGIPAPF